MLNFVIFVKITLLAPGQTILGGTVNMLHVTGSTMMHLGRKDALPTLEFFVDLVGQD
jgi:hypothetical protein